MADRFANISDDLHGPATKAVAVTPSDSADLAYISKRLHIGTGGAVKIDTSGGDTVIYTAASGTYLNVRAKRVYATGTTASNIVCEY
jgi:hypothetical protein